MPEPTTPKRPFRMPRLRLPRSLQGQLIASVWLGVAVVMVPFNYVSIRQEREKATLAVLAALRDQGEITQYIVNRWTGNINDLLQIMATMPAIRSLDRGEVLSIFERLQVLYPNRQWRLFDRAGRLIAGTGVERPVLPQQERETVAFQRAMAGRMASDVADQCLSEESCYLVSVPVYASGERPDTTPSIDPIGVLEAVVYLSDTAEDSGLKGQLEKIQFGEALNVSLLQTQAPLSMQNGQRTGTEVLMVNRDGHVVFPVTTINDAMSKLSPAALRSGPWGPFIKAADKPSQNGRFQTVAVDGLKFFTYTQSVDDDWSVVVVTDQNSSFEAIDNQMRQMLLKQLLLLALVTAVIVLVCRQVARPLRRAAATMQAFSAGDFDARIDSDREDDIGKLFSNINETGGNLVRLMEEQSQHAVTDKQLETAAKIQQQFISNDKHSSGAVDIAADFDPAYEVGADWFDVIHTEQITYVVIADVCDKGIPSSLFMSVFRSLLRYSLTKQDLDEHQQDIQARLCATISHVNDYMAENHGLSAMFATIFIAGYRAGSGTLHYISAGHEQSLVLRADGALDRLNNSGPAVGVFAGARYEPFSTPYHPGDILFTYTDGLVDTRSEAGVSFGFDRLLELLAKVQPAACTPNELLTRVQAAAAAHRGNADQFDDLTVLIMKAGMPSEPAPPNSQVPSPPAAG